MFEALLLASYGGPEGIDDIEPFLDRVLAGKHIPQARRDAVTQRYRLFDGKSPLPGECRRFLDAISKRSVHEGIPVKTYWGNFFAPPFLQDAFEQIERDNVKTVLVFASSAFGSPQSCRRYLDATRDALNMLTPSYVASASIRRLPPFFETRAFVESVAQTITEKLNASKGGKTLILFTAHSIPETDAKLASYRRQLLHASLQSLACAGLMRDALIKEPTFPSESLVLGPDAVAKQMSSESRVALKKRGLDAALAFQSRSGSPHIPWIGPDVREFLSQYVSENKELSRVLVVPIGFFFENMETIYDLDVEARDLCNALNIQYDRAPCCGASQKMVDFAWQALRMNVDELPTYRCEGDACRFQCRLYPR